MRPVVVWVSLAVLLASSIVHGASDPRLFGEYCGEHVERVRVRVRIPFIGISFRLRTVRKLVRIRAYANYRERQGGQGEVQGHGQLRWDDDTEYFVFEGHVPAHGRLEGSGMSPRFGGGTATATLNDAGTELTLDVLDRTVHLSKLDCPNTPPVATIRMPSPGPEPLRVDFGQAVRFEAEATDVEDAQIAWTRYVWSSDRSGVIGRGPALARALWGFGRHAITLSATDSGGLTSTATTEVEVINRPPRATIVRPLADTRSYTGVPILFRGRGDDPEFGELRDQQLWWFSSLNGPIGAGEAFMANLAAGTHRISLMARDYEGGLVGVDTVDIIVRQAPNPPPGQPTRFSSPPSVQITAPGDRVRVYLDAPGGCFTLRATARDLEDGTGPFHRMPDNAVQWTESVRVLGPTETRAIGKGTANERCNMRAGQHRVTATVTDSHGNTASDTISFEVRLSR